MTVDPLQLQSRGACEAFVQTSPPKAIAAQIRRDHALASNPSSSTAAAHIPSLLVHFLPKTPSTGAASTTDGGVALADKLAIELSLPDGYRDEVSYARPPLPLSICRLRYTSILSTIRLYISALPFAHLSPPAPSDSVLPPPVASTGGITTHLTPTPADLLSTLKVLSYLQLPRPGAAHLDTPLSAIATTVQNLLLAQDAGPTSAPPPPPPVPQKRKDHCYICQYAIPPALHHPFYPTLCRPCGDFNIAESALTHPANLRPLLPTPFTAVVTGARVNLGYYTALRLLRCGAHVLATTRYPFDAQHRYSTESDCADWLPRLRVVGADFRSARDAFELVGAVGAWLDEVVPETGGKLNLLVNNAAQTLTDTRDAEERMVGEERRLIRASPPSASSSSVVVRGGGYSARVGGGMPVNAFSPPTQLRLTSNGEKNKAEEKSSWTQSLHEIPYQDIITAHSINAFVPLILMRELMPRLSLPPSPLPTDNKASPSTTTTNTNTNKNNKIPNGYIITLTSRESLQEHSPAQATKQGKHVHTNMSKAAVNMLVHTQASEAWSKDGVSVVAVDPGYMSADGKWVEECVRRRGEEGEDTGGRECPLDWEDGVGRTLWVVAVGQRGRGAVWGRVLKHFTAVRG
ncbi:hypothetical protein DFH27DRAFT_596588 [Peziza echinospora]|nr:hypothetical protein DFH27DRAFT_596588 [Peziza echinospora]